MKRQWFYFLREISKNFLKKQINNLMPPPNQSPYLIAIGSKSRIGKDALADILIRLLRKTPFQAYTRISFSEPVYRIASLIQIQTGKKVEKNVPLLQFVGDGLKEVFNDPALWVPEAEEKVKGAKLQGNSVIITDLRYKEEWDMVKKHKIITLRLNGERRGEYKGDPNHKSEVDLDDEKWDFIIENDGSLEDLEEKAKGFLNWVHRM